MDHLDHRNVLADPSLTLSQQVRFGSIHFISWPHRGNFTWGDGKSTVNIPAWIALCLAAFCLTESAPVCFPRGSKILFDSLFDGWDVWPGAIAAFPRSAIPRWFRFGGATFHRLAGLENRGLITAFHFFGAMACVTQVNQVISSYSHYERAFFSGRWWPPSRVLFSASTSGCRKGLYIYNYI